MAAVGVTVSGHFEFLTTRDGSIRFVRIHRCQLAATAKVVPCQDVLEPSS